MCPFLVLDQRDLEGNCVYLTLNTGAQETVRVFSAKLQERRKKLCLFLVLNYRSVGRNCACFSAKPLELRRKQCIYLALNYRGLGGNCACI